MQMILLCMFGFAVTTAVGALRSKSRSIAALWTVSCLLAVGAAGYLVIDQGNVLRRVNQMRDPATAPAAPSMARRTDTPLSVEERTVGDNAFTVVHVDPLRSDLRLFWKREDGTRLGTFRALAEHADLGGKRLLFATNAGIFNPDHTPCGLHIQDGRQYVALNLNDGEGNFYLKPNGVFLVDVGGGRIVDAAKFGGDAVNRLHLATQSGPLLVLDGVINPALNSASVSRHVRSAVGVSSPDRVYFVLSRQPVTFYELASFFRVQLNCGDALYLDGVISRFRLPDAAGPDEDREFAGILAVVAPK